MPDPYDVYMPEARGYIQVVEARVAAMRRRLAVLRGDFRGCSCCPVRKKT